MHVKKEKKIKHPGFLSKLSSFMLNLIRSSIIKTSEFKSRFANFSYNLKLKPFLEATLTISKVEGSVFEFPFKIACYASEFHPPFSL